MSASPEEKEDAAREEDVSEGEMADMSGLPPARHEDRDDQDNHDDELPKAGQDEEDHRISELLEEERRQSSDQPPADTGVVNRYKELAQGEPEVISDNGSADALPRRAASPVDSTLSIPDDSPSVQVC